MKIICSKELLSDNINIVMKAVSNRSTLSILECILLIADAENFRLIGNDLELGIETSPIDAQIISPGSIALEAKLLSEIIRKLPNEPVSIESDEKNVTIIKCGRSEFKILGQSGEEFPFLTAVEKTDQYQLSTGELRDMIRKTIFSVAVDDSKPVMTGELFEIGDGRVRLVAVDGFRISVGTCISEMAYSGIQAVIPSKTLNEISKILPQEDERVNIYITPRHILFELTSCIIVSRLLEGDFLNYENLFTDDYTTLVTVNRDELLSCLERASLISKDAKKSPVKISIDNSNMIITSNTDIGTSHEEVAVEIDGLPIEIAFNPRYLTDALKALTEDRITVQLTTPLSPCILKGETNDLFKYLILPLRLKGQ